MFAKIGKMKTSSCGPMGAYLEPNTHHGVSVAKAKYKGFVWFNLAIEVNFFMLALISLFFIECDIYI